MHDTIYLDGHGVVLLEGKNLDRDGGSNGSGKSSIFNTIVQILFAKNPTDEVGSAIINKALGKAFGRVTFIDKSGTKWRVTDVKKWRKTDASPDSNNEPTWTDSYSGTDVYLDRWDGSSWADERSSNKNVGEGRLDLKATRKRILDIVGMDYDRFMSVSYLAQQQSMRFLTGTHKDRMSILSDIADIKSWDTRVSKVRADVAATELELKTAERELSIYSSMSGAEVSQADIDVVKSEISTLELENIAVADAISVINAANAQVDLNISKLDEESASLIKKSSALEQMRRKAWLQRSDIRTAYDAELHVAKSTPQPADIAELVSSIAEAKWNIVSKTDHLGQMLLNPGRCSKCFSNVSNTHLDRQRHLINEEIREMQAAKDHMEEELKIKLTTFDAHVNNLISAVSDKYADQLIEADNAVDSVDADTAATSARILEIQNSKVELAKLKQPSDSQYQRTYQIMSIISSKMARLDTLVANMKSWKEHESAKAKVRSNILDLSNKIKHLRVLDRLFGDKGVKAFKLDSALCTLNTLLQKYADIVTDHKVDLWVTQYREKSDGDLATDVQIMVRETGKEGVPFALYSGGERQQMVLAFIASFWELATNYGSGVNILCLDEIFGPLDDSNAEKVFSFVEAIKAKGKSTIFIVTHDDSIRSKMPLDAVWTVVKLKHQSKIEMP